MTPLWTFSDAAQATGGTAHGTWSVTGLSIDTRTIQPGDMFIALKAARDGHDFVPDALAKGAACALVSRIPDNLPKDAPLLVVADVQTALEDLARAARKRTKAKVLAITGSVGKTSTKDMAAHVLRAQGKTHAAEKSYNNHWGVPLTLARMPAEADFAAIEIGMNHPGEIAPLAQLAQPDVAIVTTVGPVHLEAFPDGVPGIAREKASIFSGLAPQGVALWNADLDVSSLLQENAGPINESFGTTASTWHLTDVESRDGALFGHLTHQDDVLSFQLGAAGHHFALNAVAVLAAVAHLGGDVAQAAESLTTWSPPPGRGARSFIPLGAGGIDLIDDSYNANPSSVAAGFEVLTQIAPTGAGRRVAILGDMKELGATENARHTALAELPAISEIDQIHCIGPLMAHLYDALPATKRGTAHPSVTSLLPHLASILTPGDVVLVKGSFSMDMAAVVDALHNMGDGPS